MHHPLKTQLRAAVPHDQQTFDATHNFCKAEGIAIRVTQGRENHMHMVRHDNDAVNMNFRAIIVQSMSNDTIAD